MAWERGEGDGLGAGVRGDPGPGAAPAGGAAAGAGCAAGGAAGEPGDPSAAVVAGAPVVELHTGAYADAPASQQAFELERIVSAAKYASDIGLVVNAGHGLHYDNVTAIAVIPQIVELNIGHAIISRAVFDGMAEAVADMKQLMLAARQG